MIHQRTNLADDDDDDAIETTLTTLPSPFCFVCIVRSGYEPVDPLEKELMDCIKVALQCCETRPGWNLSRKNEGNYFEKFVTESLTARIITCKLFGAPIIISSRWMGHVPF